MINLAGVDTCDETIKQELFASGIPTEVVEIDRRHHEVPFTIIGRLGPYKFERLWYYWSVTGPMPLAAAQEMYEHEFGCKDVRVVGHCGCPPPAEWLDDGHVTSYHIDTQAGLTLFTQTVRKHGLVDE